MQEMIMLPAGTRTYSTSSPNADIPTEDKPRRKAREGKAKP